MISDIEFPFETGRIVGGTEAKRHAFPWQVAVMRDYHKGNGLEIACGGSILSKIWAVSASHCFYDCPKEDTRNCNMDYCPYKRRREADNNDYLLRFGEFDLADYDTV